MIGQTRLSRCWPDQWEPVTREWPAEIISNEDGTIYNYAHDELEYTNQNAPN